MVWSMCSESEWKGGAGGVMQEKKNERSARTYMWSLLYRTRTLLSSVASFKYIREPEKKKELKFKV